MLLAIIQNVLGILQTIPLLRSIVVRLLEGDLEIEVHAPLTRSMKRPLRPSKPIFTVQVGHVKQATAWCDVVFINHSRNGRKRIIGATLHLKKRRFRFWRSTIASAQFDKVTSSASGLQYEPFLDILLEPVSSPVAVSITAEAPITIPISELPGHLELILELRLVGPLRRFKYLLSSFAHNPSELLGQEVDRRWERYP